MGSSREWRRKGEQVRTALGVVMMGLVAASYANSETSVERGKYLVEVLGACGNCHTPKGPQGDIREKHMAGGFEIEEEFGVAISPNITPDMETGIGTWTDAEIIRTIREGKRKDGRTLGPPMPFYLYRNLSDRDVTAIVTYLRMLRPIKNKVPPSRYTIPLPGSYGPPVGAVPDVSKRDLVKYGEYLAGPVAHCVDCHTPRGPDGQPDQTRFGAGAFPFRGPWGTSYSANLTPDAETGIGALNDGQIIAAIYGARRDGQRVLPPMPSPYYAAGITSEDMQAIIAYLRALKPIKNKVPPPEPPEKQ